MFSEWDTVVKWLKHVYKNNTGEVVWDGGKRHDNIWNNRVISDQVSWVLK